MITTEATTSPAAEVPEPAPAVSRTRSTPVRSELHVLRPGSGATAIGYIVDHAWCVRLARFVQEVIATGHTSTVASELPSRNTA